MSKYSIKDLENLSGIKAHTIRIWEQRYNLVKPERTSTNIRYYNSADLKHLLKVAMLNKGGLKISKIASMSEVELNSHIESLAQEEENNVGRIIHLLTDAMLDLNESQFERTLSTCILQMGLEDTMYKVIMPFLTRIGLLWQTDSITPAQEHFISCLLRQKLIVAIDGQGINYSSGSRFVLFLPEGELHELTLLFSSYILKKEGHQVIYLGQNLPFADVVSVYKVYKPQYLLSIFTAFPRRKRIQQYINDLSDNFKQATILLSGYGVINNDLTFPANVKVLKMLNELKSYLPEN